MTRISNRNPRRAMFPCCRGTSVVEAAIVTLGLFSMVFGIMESGRFMSIQQTLTDAAREGARVAVAPTSQTFTLPNNADIQNRVGYFLTSNGIPLEGAGHATIKIERDVTVGSAADTFTRVSVSYPYKIMSLQMFGNLEVDLSGTARMRNETSR